MNVTEHLSGLPLRNEYLKNMQYLHPFLKKHKKGTSAITCVTKKLPHVVPEEELPTLKIKWLEYCTSDTPTEWPEDENGKYLRIYHYWNKVTGQKTNSGCVKYPVMTSCQISTDSCTWKC